MFNSEWLDIAIGVVLVWFLFAVVVSGINELGNRLLSVRSKQLWLALNMLLDGHKSKAPFWQAIGLWLYRGRPKSPDATLALAPPPGLAPPEDAAISGGTTSGGTTTADTAPMPDDLMKRRWTREPGPVTKALYATATVQSQENRPNPKRKTKINNLPNQVFVQALIELGVRDPDDGQKQVEELIARLPDSGLRRQLVALWASTKGDIVAFRVEVERWFDGQMARVSAIYRAQVRWVLLALGIGVAFLGFAFGLRADAIRLVSDLQRDQNLRTYFATTAAGISPQQLADLGCPPTSTSSAPSTTLATGATTTVPAPDLGCQLRGLDKLGSAGLILDESVRELPSSTAPSENLNWFTRIFERKGDVPERLGSLDPFEDDGGRRLLGVVITGVAISFGASFWYNVLRRLVGLRQGGKSAPSA